MSLMNLGWSHGILRDSFNIFRGTARFKVSVSDSGRGPWEEIVSGRLWTETFKIKPPVEAEYVRFDCLSWYGDGCGLQYFGVFDVTHHNAGDKHGKIVSRTMSYMKIELMYEEY